MNKFGFYTRVHKKWCPEKCPQEKCPRENCPPEISPPGKLAPGNKPPRKIAHYPPKKKKRKLR